MFGTCSPHQGLGLTRTRGDPGLTPLFFAIGYAAAALVTRGRRAHGEESNYPARGHFSDPRHRHREPAAGHLPPPNAQRSTPPYGVSVVRGGRPFLSTPRVIAFFASIGVGRPARLVLARTDTGKAILCAGRQGEDRARRLWASTSGPRLRREPFGLGARCRRHRRVLRCRPSTLNPYSGGGAFVPVALTIVVLGRHGLDPRRASSAGSSSAWLESLSGTQSRARSLGQIGIFIIFILVLLLRPTGLFGAKA